jgi:CRP-like cAMP-binding protein
LVAEVIPPGELFGAIVALENRPYPATAIAPEPSVVWGIPAALARELCQPCPARGDPRTGGQPPAQRSRTAPIGGA